MKFKAHGDVSMLVQLLKNSEIYINDLIGTPIVGSKGGQVWFITKIVGDTWYGMIENGILIGN